MRFKTTIQLNDTMKNVISTEKIPIKMWLDDIEPKAMEQAKNLANLPFAFKHIAIMPDSHEGYGMPIGSVLATKGVVIPNAVGVDIGCGMCAIQTNIKDIEKENLKKILGHIRQSIPVGFDWHSESQDSALMPDGYDELFIVKKEYDNAKRQIGTLGGGNHFIEIQKGSDGFIWIMIHSGSRNIGYSVANHYNEVAIRLNEKYFSSVTKEKQLAFLPIESKEAKDYIKEMKYCIEFALANRKLMMSKVLDAIYRIEGDFNHGELINKSHNFAAWEHHFGENVLVHRKGATKAYIGEFGMIPGSQGTKSYIVRGLGNEESFHSCSHGAGRKLGRKQAQRELNLMEEISNLNKKGIIHSIRNQKDLDESPSAYKDIDQVMENQKDLVEILIELEPLAVVKG